jgi:PiT family inorganic phosphate transporter
MRAGFVVGILGFSGAVLQGANVTNAVGTELIGGVTLTVTAAVVALLTAAVLVALGVFAGYPIATAFTVTGAVVGVGLALGGVPAWAKYQQIVSLWVLTPFIGGGASYLTARILRSERFSEASTVPVLAGVIGILVANMEFAGLGPQGESASLARTAAVELAGTGVGETVWFVVSMLLFGVVAVAIVGRWMRVDPTRGQRRFLLVLGGLVAFSAGGSQVGLAIGPLVPLLDAVTVPLPALLVGGGLGLLAGSWTGAPRMIKALAQDYSSLGPRRSIAAMIPSFAIAQTAVALGVPVSFNEIIVSAIIGSGFAAGGSGVSKQKMLYTVLAWVGSLLLAFGLGFGVFTLLSNVLSV